MLQYNREFGCAKCETKGAHLSTHVYPIDNNAELRVTDTVDATAAKVYKSESGELEKRIKSQTELSLWVYDFIRTTVIDDLHCVYLGVTKHLMKLWFDNSYTNEDWSLSGSIERVNTCLRSIKPPSFVQRLPRTLELYSH